MPVDARCNDLGLTIAVRDHRPERVPPLPPVDPGSQRLAGLFVVAALSREWGVTPRIDEKSVWAFLAVGDSANYSHTIRRAAHDVVRAVLGHGANSRVAASAVRRITAWLAVQHGASAVRDLAAELALELARPRWRRCMVRRPAKGRPRRAWHPLTTLAVSLSSNRSLRLRGVVDASAPTV
jgi:hypothetical protein